MIKRALADQLKKSKKSILLLGPRQTGKSTLIHSLGPDIKINLAHEPTFLDFTKNPSELEERLKGGAAKTVLIDEVQRLPHLLNTIQFLLDERPSSLKFYLTGSSASKLKRGKANLLPGRIHSYFLGALTAGELGYSMDTKQALSTGTLPGIWVEESMSEKQKTLQTYAATYLKEEIQAEALTRNIEGFSRFLFVAASASGRFLDFSKLSSEARIPRQSAVRYFEVLEDTLIVKRCEAFRKSHRKRLVQSPRFFFFDTGVLNGLMENFIASQDRIGALFKHLVFNQLVHSAAAKDRAIRISSYRTEHGAEVDFILEMDQKVTAIEVKATSNMGKYDFRGLKSFGDYLGKKHRAVLLYMGSVPKVVEGVDVLPWQIFLKEMDL